MGDLTTCGARTTNSTPGPSNGRAGANGHDAVADRLAPSVAPDGRNVGATSSGGVTGRRPRSEHRTAAVKPGLVIANEVVTESIPRRRNALDDVLTAGLSVAMETLLHGTNPTVTAGLDRLTALAVQAEQARRYGTPERVETRVSRVLDRLRHVARRLPDAEAVRGAVFAAAGELMQNGGAVPPAWDDAVDADCAQRGLRDAVGLPTTLIATSLASDTCDDATFAGAAAGNGNANGNVERIATEEPALIYRGYDFQLQVNEVRCVRPTEDSDEFRITPVRATYEDVRVATNRYARDGFEAVDAESDGGADPNRLDPGDFNVADGSLDPTDIEVLRVRLKRDPLRLTRLDAILLPTDEELNPVVAQAFTDVLTLLAGALVDEALDRISALARLIPVAGSLLARIFQLDLLRDALKDLLGEQITELFEFLKTPDKFTGFQVRAFFAWPDLDLVPLVDYRIIGRTFGSRIRVRRVALRPITAAATTGFLPTVQSQQVGNRERLGPAEYQVDFRSNGYLRTFRLNPPVGAD